VREEAARKQAQYLYAIVPGKGSRIYGDFGLNHSRVYTISDGRLAAVVSNVPNGKIRAERQHLAAHQEVLKRLMAESAVLPVSFGVVAEGPQALRRVLAENRETLREQLDRVAGKVEMGLRIMWDVPNIFEYFVNTHPELRAARDRLLGPQRNPTQSDKIELGRMFDRLLNEDREAHLARVEEALAPRCVEIKRNPPRNESEVANLACLVERGAQARFEAGVFTAAKSFDNNFAFDFNGPWPPYNFVQVRLDL
jgi:Gas vesicle synthesis protein GvpL/GvpF